VPEDHIIFITILASSEGVCLVSHLHPHVRIVCAQIDDEFNQSEGVILPGLGRFGDRYFGTEEC
jgi:uracil phosphoribosyltransferase